MIDSQADALDLITAAELQLEKINNGYRECLHAESVPNEYLILYKNFLENLRSALDYTARGIFLRYGKAKSKEPHIYFPYIPYRTMSREEYDKRKIFNKKLPGVEINRPDIRDYILSLSDYNNGTEWFLGFMVITNQKKHVQLVKQHVKEDVKLELPGISIQASSIVIKEGGSFVTDSGTLKGPYTARPGVTTALVGGQTVTPSRERYLYIKGHFGLGTADSFAAHCHGVIGDVVRRLVQDPPLLK